MSLRRQMVLGFSLMLVLLFPIALIVEYRLSQRLSRDWVTQQFAFVAELLEEKLLEPFEDIEEFSESQGLQGHWEGEAKLNLAQGHVIDWRQSDGTRVPLPLQDLLEKLQEVPLNSGYIVLLDRYGTSLALAEKKPPSPVELPTPIVEKVFSLKNTDRVLLQLLDPLTQQTAELIVLVAPQVGLAVGVVIPERALQDKLAPLVVHLLRASLVLLAVVWVAFYLLSRRVTAPLEELAQAITRSAHGEFNLQLPESNVQEIKELSDAFSKMRSELTEYLEQIQRSSAEAARVGRELELARTIQGNADLEIRLQGWQATGKSEPAREVGGDFMDLFELPSGRLGLIVGDVSGKGIPAALHTLLARSGLKLGLSRSESPAQALQDANALLAIDNHDSVFVTALVGLFDPAQEELTWARAGHPTPLTQEGQLTGPNGPPLGLLEDVSYQQVTTNLKKQAYLFYTDGFSEAENKEGEFLTVGPIQQALAEGRDLWELLNAYRAGAEPNDDATALLLCPITESPT